jgi:hypothetical protein
VRVIVGGFLSQLGTSTTHLFSLTNRTTQEHPEKLAMMRTSRAVVVLHLGFAALCVTADNSAFMMVSGISASSEMCLTVPSGVVDVIGATLGLEPCAAAVAAGDGRELWQHLPNGEISNIAGKKCIGVDGDVVTLVGCDGSSIWELQGDGQLKLGGSGQYCLSQRGPAVGLENVAVHGAISASSSADVAAHGANMAVDGSSSTFWASALDAEGPVTIIADLGGKRHLSMATLEWEFPAKAFTVSVSTDGSKWIEVYATDSNVLRSTSIPLGFAPAAMVRVVMHEASSAVRGRAVYGLRELALYTPRLSTIIEDCSVAAKSSDARDKYFETFVGESESSSSDALRSELPSLQAAQASVASVVADLQDILPKIKSCHGAAAFMRSEGTAQIVSQPTMRAMMHTGSSQQSSVMAQYVENENAVGTNGARALLKEARRIIIEARSALF